MWFQNKLTGVKWQIIDTSHINRLKADKNYEVVADPSKPKQATKPKATTRKKSAPAKKG